MAAEPVIDGWEEARIEAGPASSWVPAGSDLPVVTIAGLTIKPSARQLLAATHGRGAYQLTLP